MIPRAILVVAFAMLALLSSSPVSAFTSIASPPVTRQISTLLCAETTSSATEAASSNKDPNELVARRITVVGDVQGGYYRACVKNEASRFRRLVGTMTPPDDSDEAEIYVEGKLKMVDGFIRWCRKGDVGLSQQATVKDVKDEEPTGLYDGFYVRTK